MTGSWWKRLIIGLVVAIIALIIVPRFNGNGQFYQPIVLPGIAIGAALAVIPGAGMGGRIGGFLLGGLFGTMIFLLRGLMFPQTPTGTAAASAFGILMITIVWIASVGYWPMWAGLLGWLLVEAAYEARFAIQPTLMTRDMPAYILPSLTAATITFIVVMILVLIFGEDRLKLPIEKEAEDASTPSPEAAYAGGAVGTDTAENATVSMTPAQ